MHSSDTSGTTWRKNHPTTEKAQRNREYADTMTRALDVARAEMNRGSSA